ncbi:MAG: hypothetical protein ACREJU_12360 [Nitrospiraceae bacterium]
MPRIYVVLLMLSIGALVVFPSVPAIGHDDGQTGGFGPHREMNVIVTKVTSGIIFVEPFEGLRPRTISPNKADRAGLHESKPGDEVTLIVDEGNVLIDVHKTGIPSAGHRMVIGTLNYADAYWGEIKLSTPEGIERFDVDALAGSKLSVFQEGAPVTVELDEDNMLIDIHRSR